MLRIGRIGNGRTGAMGSLTEADMPSCPGKRVILASVLPPFRPLPICSRLRWRSRRHSFPFPSHIPPLHPPYTPFFLRAMEAAPDRSLQQRTFCEFIWPSVAASRLLHRFLDDDTRALRDLDAVTGAHPQPVLQAQPGLQACDKFVRTVLATRMGLGREEEEKALKERMQETLVIRFRLPGENMPSLDGCAVSYTGEGKYRPPPDFKQKSLLQLKTVD